MALRRTHLAVGLTGLLLCGLLVGLYASANHYAKHLGWGPKRVFPLPGMEPLTEQQALDFATRTLKLDGRFSAGLEPFDLGSAGHPRYLNRASANDLTGSVTWLTRSHGTKWYVYMERKKDRVVCWSFPSK